MNISQKEKEALRLAEERFDPKEYIDSYPEKIWAAIKICDYLRMRKALKYGFFVGSILFNVITGAVVLIKRFGSRN